VAQFESVLKGHGFSRAESRAKSMRIERLLKKAGSYQDIALAISQDL
jgi:hypothetical protein